MNVKSTLTLHRHPKADKFNLPVMEHFYTIQGEGFNTGKAAYFIRLGGCDVGCVWCDVKESWDALQHDVLKVGDIVKFIQSEKAINVVITGGEPLLYDLEELTHQLKVHKINRWLETSGSSELSGKWDWICVSPKKFKPPLKSVLQKAHELKIVIFNSSDFKWAEEHAALTESHCKLYLQPEFSMAEKMLPQIIEYVKQNQQWNISLQTHKIINVP